MPLKRFGKCLVPFDMMEVALQRKLQQSGPIMIMFQQNEQAVARSNVKGFVLGPSFDTVVYWQTTK